MYTQECKNINKCYTESIQDYLNSKFSLYPYNFQWVVGMGSVYTKERLLPTRKCEARLIFSGFFYCQAEKSFY